MSAAACQCGSGLSFARCHGDPRNRYARVEALREAESVAALFPFVRVSGIEAIVERAAADLRGSDVPDAVVEALLAQVDVEERRRVVELWARPYADRWESMTTAAGDAAAAERALVAGAVRAAVHECGSTPRELVEPLESGRAQPPPFAALGVVLPPPFVWSADEARAAIAGGRGCRSQSDRLDVVEAIAFALMSFDHVSRTRALAARLARELPFAGLPRASRLLGEACAAAEADLGAARASTAALLIAYSETLSASEAVAFG